MAAAFGRRRRREAATLPPPTGCYLAPASKLPTRPSGFLVFFRSRTANSSSIISISIFQFSPMQDGSLWGRLELEPADVDDFFISGRAQIQIIDEANNVSSSMRDEDWRPIRGCFYRGQVHQRDPGDSKAALSLCHGLVNLDSDD